MMIRRFAIPLALGSAGLVFGLSLAAPASAQEIFVPGARPIAAQAAPEEKSLPLPSELRSRRPLASPIASTVSRSGADTPAGAAMTSSQPLTPTGEATGLPTANGGGATSNSAQATGLPLGTGGNANGSPIGTQGTGLPIAPAGANSNQPMGTYAPTDPLPINDRVQSAAETEAERAYYDAKRKRHNDTYQRAYEGLVPLGPGEVRDTMNKYEQIQRAAIPPAAGQPKGEVRIRTLSLEPGSEPPTINIAAGYVTTITILDATGQPWPIMDIGIGGNFEVSKTGAGSHVVRVMPLTRFGFGNVSVLLQDLSTPIIFKLASGGATVDYRFDARIPKLGPNAKLSLIDQQKQLEAGGPLIMSFLDNAPPAGALRARVTGADSRTMAWMYNEKMYVRTPLTLLSPSWDASVASADGTTVYELRDTPILLLSDNGNVVRARLAQKEKE